MSEAAGTKPQPRARPTGTSWNKEATRLMKAEMARHGVSYKELALLMGAESGEDESPTALITRVNRGTFTMAFFLEAVVAMGTKTIDLTHLEVARHRRLAGSTARR